MRKRVLLIFVEPTPYILDFIKNLYSFSDSDFEVQVFFLKENLTQNWNIILPKNCSILKKKTRNIFNFFCEIFFFRSYDLIHVAGWSQPICLFLILVSRIFKIPLVVESDTQYSIDSTVFRKILKKIIYPTLFKLPSAFLPGGTRQAQYFTRYNVRKEKVFITQMTVDVERITNYVSQIEKKYRSETRNRYGACENEIVFLFVGRLLIWKGILDILKAFKELNSVFARFWIVGDGELRENIIQLIACDSRIHYFGRKDGLELLDIYCAADVVLVPSHHEPWGLVVNEAMAAGKPVIVSERVGCSDDLVINGKTGFVVLARDVDSLRDKMNHMIENPNKRGQMAVSALELISNWTLKKEVTLVISAWNKIIGEKWNKACV